MFLPRLLFVAGLVFLAFVLGSWTAWRDIFPFRDHLRKSFIGLDALISKYHPGPGGGGNDSVSRDKAREKEPRGVDRHDPSRAFPGFTLIAVGQSAHLLDMEGKIRHTWRLDYETIRGAGAVAPGKLPSSNLYWRPAKLLEGGDLLAVVTMFEATPLGLALVRMDRESRPLWVYHGHVHHDVDIAPDGRVLTLGQSIRDQAPPGLENLRGPLLDEFVLELSAGGKLLRKVSILEAFAGSPYRTLLNRTAGRMRYKEGDYLHSNNVDYVDAPTAARFPFTREGQVLISLRNVSTIAVLDLDRGTVTWARRGEWWQQHDPDFLDNGNILLFDNQGDWDRGGRSRVIEWDPRSGAIVWQFPGGGGESLWTNQRGEQQMLPNGNILLNEYMGGRLLEVTRGGDVVWEFRSPLEMPGAPGRFYRIMHGERHPPEAAGFPLNEGRPAAPSGDRARKES